MDDILRKLLDDAEKTIKQAREYANKMGIDFPEDDMIGWVTLKWYAKTYKVDKNILIHWIEDGTIPKECVREIYITDVGSFVMIKNKLY